MQKVDLLEHRLSHPGERIRRQIIQLQHLQDRFSKIWAHQTERKQWQINELKQRLQRILYNRTELKRSAEKLDQLSNRLQQAHTRYHEGLSIKLQQQQAKLKHLNPQSVLERGYSITYSTQGEIIHNANQLHADEKIQVKFAQGRVDATIENIKKD